MGERIPYPVDQRGVPYNPQDFNVCYEVCLKGIKNTNRHHLAFERRNYNSLTERRYRQAASMIVEGCVCKHEDLHATYLPPEIPEVGVMQEVADGRYEPREAEVWIRSKSDTNLENVC